MSSGVQDWLCTWDGTREIGGGQVRDAILVLLGRLGHASDLCDVVKC